MTARGANLKTCDNCKQHLHSMLDQQAVRRFCCEDCADEWAAKRAVAIMPAAAITLANGVREYLLAVAADRGTAAHLGRLWTLAEQCWPDLRAKKQPAAPTVPGTVGPAPADPEYDETLLFGYRRSRQ